MPEKKLETGTLFRSFALQREGADTETRSIPLSFSSEEPYKRWFGTEILDHSPAAVRLDRMKQAGPLLLDHDTRDQIGVVEDIQITNDKVGRAVVRFSQSARAQEIYQDVLDGIRVNVSVGYIVHRMKLEESSDEEETYRATDWEPMEISIVSVPADTTVGVNRAAEGDHKSVIEYQEKQADEQQPEPAPIIKEQKTMPEKIEVVENKRDMQKDVDKILAIADSHDAHQLATAHIRKGSTVEDFVCALLETRGATAAPVTPEIGLTKDEAKRYSMVRALHALANPSDRHAQEAAAYERECSDAAAKILKREATGFLVPYDVMTRDLTVGTTTAGGYLKGTDHLAGSFIDALRNRMMVQKMGARVIDGLVGDVAIPKLSGGASTYWVAESGAPTEGAETFGQVTLAPKTIGAYVDISRKLLKQSSPAADMLVEDDLSIGLALGIDLAALHGTGSSNQPTGIAATSGIGSVVGGTNGAAPDWADMVALWAAVAVDNADLGSMGYLTNSKVIGKLMTTDKASGAAQFICPAFPNAEGYTSIGGMRCGVSNQVSAALTKGTSSGTASAIFFGNWADLIIGAWGGLDLTVDPYSGSTTGTVRVVALQDVDIAVRHAESFAAMLDALTA